MTLSTGLSRIPTLSMLLRSSQPVHDLVAAFNISRDTIASLTSDQTRPLAARDIHLKWCHMGLGDAYQTLSSFPMGVICVLLFDIWRDILMIRLNACDVSAYVGSFDRPYVL